MSPTGGKLERLRSWYRWGSLTVFEKTKESQEWNFLPLVHSYSLYDILLWYIKFTCCPLNICLQLRKKFFIEGSDSHAAVSKTET